MSKKGKGKGKKGKEKKGKKEEKEDEVTLDQVLTTFKKECKTLNIDNDLCNGINDILNEYITNEDKGVLTQLCVSIPIDGLCLKAFLNTINKTKYKKLKCLCFWGSNIGDIGCKYVGELITNEYNKISKLEIRDCNVTDKGCDMLSKYLLKHNRSFKHLQILRFDFNRFKNKGIYNIACGLKYNSSLKCISFAFCDITDSNELNDALILMLTTCNKLELNILYIYVFCKHNKIIIYIEN